MKVELEKFSIYVSFSIERHGDNPWVWSRNRQRKFAKEIVARSLKDQNSTQKIPLIVAARRISAERKYISRGGGFGFGLREAKEFVEMMFEDGTARVL